MRGHISAPIGVHHVRCCPTDPPARPQCMGTPSCQWSTDSQMRSALLPSRIGGGKRLPLHSSVARHQGGKVVMRRGGEGPHRTAALPAGAADHLQTADQMPVQLLDLVEGADDRDDARLSGEEPPSGRPSGEAPEGQAVPSERPSTAARLLSDDPTSARSSPTADRGMMMMPSGNVHTCRTITLPPQVRMRPPLSPNRCSLSHPRNSQVSLVDSLTHSG